MSFGLKISFGRICMPRLERPFVFRKGKIVRGFPGASVFRDETKEYERDYVLPSTCTICNPRAIIKEFWV